MLDVLNKSACSGNINQKPDEKADKCQKQHLQIFVIGRNAEIYAHEQDCDEKRPKEFYHSKNLINIMNRAIIVMPIITVCTGDSMQFG